MREIAHLVHLKCRGDGLDQHGASDGTSGHANIVLSQVENVVPHSGLQMALHLRKIKVWASSSLDQLLSIVVEVYTKIEEGGGDGLAIDGEMLFDHVPAACTGDEGGENAVGAELVFLLTLLEVDLPSNGIVKIELAIDDVVPGWGGSIYSPQSMSALRRGEKSSTRTFKIGHVGPDICIKSIDDHATVGGTGDFNAAVSQAWGGWRPFPGIVLADVLGFGEEVELFALVEVGLAYLAAFEQRLSSLVEGAVEEGEEDGDILVQDVLGLIIESAMDVDVF